MNRRDFLALGVAALAARKLSALARFLKHEEPDDTSRIQGAINRAQAQGGGIVTIPPGTYRINATIKSGMNQN